MVPYVRANRRTFLTTTGIALTGLLAGCSSGGDEAEVETTEKTQIISETATPTQPSTPTPTETNTPTATARQKQVNMVTGEAEGSSAFKPRTVEVAVDTLVTWVNQKGFPTHTVTAYDDQIPEAAEYFASGGFDNEQAARDGYPESGGITGEGATYSHLFEVKGKYEYFCIPHEEMGMVGTINVV